MNSRSLRRKTRAALASVVLGFSLVAPVFAQPATQEARLSELSTRTWSVAHDGKTDDLVGLLHNLPQGDSPELNALRANAASLDKNLAKREETRQKKLVELNTKLDEQLAKTDSDSLSEALKTGVEIFMVTKPEAKDAFKNAPRTVGLIKRADAAAHEAEAKADWFKANELFFRLNSLLEEEGTYKADMRRLGLRLAMIRTYAPEEFWTLRNEERKKENAKSEKKKPDLPPYNGLGEDFREKITGISKNVVLRALDQAASHQIDGEKYDTDMKKAMLGGIDALRTMATTSDLKKAFPGLEDKAKSDEFVAFLDDWTGRLNTGARHASPNSLDEFAKGVLEASQRTVGLSDAVVLHEFGNGAMATYDEFSAIIWPDEVARFDRMTQGNFRGVGVQIQMDDESQMIKVVTPLEGTPAQRGGIKAGDLIKKINGKSAVGISLNQAVDLITGPIGSPVTMTMERKIEAPAEDAKDGSEDIDFTLKRDIIPLVSVKGWKRNGAKETDWDYLIDPANHIGYIRLLQFTEDTTRDLKTAIRTLRKEGPLNGVIVDLRFNPGGLLTEAVSVASTFVDHGTIVSTQGRTVEGETKEALSGPAMLKGVPVAMLINEGSASASEIVSGAVRYYADKGDIHAVLVGQRSFGKGSVQNVWTMSPNTKMKLTTQYYKLPDGRILHRRPGASVWGVDPHLRVDELPEALSDAIKLRTDADVCTIDKDGNIVCNPKAPRPDPQKLLDDGLDVQLQTALFVLQAEAAPKATTQARLPQPQ